MDESCRHNFGWIKTNWRRLFATRYQFTIFKNVWTLAKQNYIYSYVYSYLCHDSHFHFIHILNCIINIFISISSLSVYTHIYTGCGKIGLQFWVHETVYSYSYLLIIVLFCRHTTINPLEPHPVCVYTYTTYSIHNKSDLLIYYHIVWFYDYVPVFSFL